MPKVYTLTTTDGQTLAIMESAMFKITDNGTFRTLLYKTIPPRAVVRIIDTIADIQSITEVFAFFTDLQNRPVGLRADRITRFFADPSGNTRIITETGEELVQETLSEVETIINGTGAGNIVGRNGFIDYNDASTNVTPITLLAGTWTDIPNDGQGASSNDLYAPNGVTQLIDTTTGYITPQELSLGDTIIIRNDFVITPSVDNASLSFRYMLGSGVGEYTLETRKPRLDDGAGIPYRESLTTELIYMGDLNTLQNDTRLQVNLSVDGQLVNNGTVVSLIKR